MSSTLNLSRAGNLPNGFGSRSCPVSHRDDSPTFTSSSLAISHSIMPVDRLMFPPIGSPLL